MAWFSPYKSVLNASTGNYESKPLFATARRKIQLNNVQLNVSAGDLLYVNLKSLNINSYYNSSLQKVTDDFSYIVVLEDYADEDVFIPVKNRIINNVLYFVAEEAIQKETLTSRYYSIYYGSTYIKALEETVIGGEPAFITNEYGNSSIPEGLYYDLATNQIDYYTYSIDSSYEGTYSLAYYNSGIDWIDNVSQKAGAKLFGVFDGPKFRLIGSVGKQYGKFKIRIFPLNQEGTFSSFPTVDWVTIDCYSSTSSDNYTLYSKVDLDYNKYIFELEVLNEKNIMSLSNSVKIDKSEFTPNYGLEYGKEEINSDLSFIKIYGV